MKYDHVVNYNGCYYQAGNEVPVTNEKNAGDNIETLSPEPEANDFSDSDIELETFGTLYTKEDLEQMTVKKIKQIAEEKGFSITSTLREPVIQEFLDKQ